jgi:hypothetical protein
MSNTLKLETVPANQAPIDPGDILTAAEVAQRLKVKPSWIHEQTRQRARIRANGNPIPYHRVGKFLRFHWPEVSAWWLRQ